MDRFNKICFYDCLGSDVAITIKATQTLPSDNQQLTVDLRGHSGLIGSMQPPPGSSRC